MLSRMQNRLKFHLERLLLRGAHYRLLVIAALIGLVSVVAGGLLLESGADFDSGADAVWWAFLRLTDPGYLGDDEGLVRRIISTAVTVLGYVLFMGALIAIMTQWLNQTIAKLERGFTPIARNNHILVLGWTNRTAAIVREMLNSEERVSRFLRRRGARGLHLVILAEEVDSERWQELRDQLGDLWSAKRITLRSGSPLRIEHLERGDFIHAAAIVLPGGDFVVGGAEVQDARTIKSLMTISHGQRQDEAPLPLMVTEIFDARKLHLARQAYAGPIEVLASDLFISRLMAQTVRHPGVGAVFTQLLGEDSDSKLFVRSFAELAGARFQDLTAAFPQSIPLGVVRPHGGSFSPYLNPPDGFMVEEGDRVVLLGRSYEDCAPAADWTPRPLQRGAPIAEVRQEEMRILLLGWNHKVPELLQEFNGYAGERFVVDLLSLVPVAERLQKLAYSALDAEKVKLSQLHGDYTVPNELEKLALGDYDCIVLPGSDWLESGDESDARTLLGFLLVQDLLPETGRRPRLLVELMDRENAPLLGGRDEEVLVSPQVLSHMLAQVALRRELRAVFDELFGPGGAEIFFRPAAEYGSGEIRFGQLQEEAFRQGEIALGVRRAGKDGLQLNPGPESRWVLDETDEVVVLSTFAR